MNKKIMPNLPIENASLCFKNFSGEQGKFNAKGNRHFSVYLTEEDAIAMEADGWNIRWLKPRDPEDARQPILPVGINFTYYPPTIVVIAGNNKRTLNEKSVSMLDWAEIEHVDLVIRPYQWKMHEGTKNESSGVKAYLKAIYVTIALNPFESKYEDVPDSAINSFSVDDEA